MYALSFLTNLLPEKYRDRAKALWPAIGTLAAVAVQWIASGEFSKSELSTAITGLITALVVYGVPNRPKA